MPSTGTFSSIDFSYSTLESRIRELAFLNSNIEIILCDLRNKPHVKSHFNDSKESEDNFGTANFVRYLDKNKTHVTKIASIRDDVKDLGTSVEISMEWNDSYYENMLCFTNNIRQRDGGTHLAGFRSALTRCINNYANNEGFLKKAKVNLTGEDVREGLTCVLSLKMPDPKFSSQTKDKLVSSEARAVVESIVFDKLSTILETDPKLAASIVERAIRSAKGREAARKARELVKNKNNINIATLPGKLADCQEKVPELSELFIVEGNSAGGTAKQGRNRKTQAVLALRGKILNVERAGLDLIFSSAEIGSLITAIGAGIGSEHFDIEKTRYHKIIIMTDADVDGSHIRTLILTFFFRHMREVIEKGYLYIAQPPLYKVTKNESQETEIKIKSPSALAKIVMDYGKKGLTLQRFKGLGEMNADQLWETTLNPETRTLLKVEIKDCEEADSIFSVLMGDIVEPRRDFINNNALNVHDVDI
nr:unnamed protein product [Callosobruchus chinensis]